MFLLVRDEDVPTVSAAIQAYATEEGLTPIEGMGSATAFVSNANDGVLVGGLEALDIAEIDEWATKMSLACGAEVVAFEVAEDGVRVFIYDEGECEEAIEVPLNPSGRTKSAELEEVLDDFEGVDASTVDELAQGLLEAFGAAATDEEPLVLGFEDPLDSAPALRVDPIPMVTATVGTPVTSPVGHMFAITLANAQSLEGCTLELSGDALQFLLVQSIDVALRPKDGTERVIRQYEGSSATIEDASLQGVNLESATFDMADMFSTMQRLVSATTEQQENTMLVGVSALATGRGEGELILTVSPSDSSSPVGAGQGSLVVRIG